MDKLSNLTYVCYITAEGFEYSHPSSTLIGI